MTAPFCNAMMRRKLRPRHNADQPVGEQVRTGSKPDNIRKTADHTDTIS